MVMQIEVTAHTMAYTETVDSMRVRINVLPHLYRRTQHRLSLEIKTSLSLCKSD